MSIKITSDWAFIDVKDGRHELADHFKTKGTKMGPCAHDVRIPVYLRGYITGEISDDDGVSIEFGVDIDKIHIGEIGGDLDD